MRRLTFLYSLSALGLPLLVGCASVGGNDAGGERCASNIKQLAMGVAMYMGDSDDFFPLRNWGESTKPYVKNDELYRCPILDKGRFGYALNSHFAGRSLAAIGDEKLAQEPAVFETENTIDSSVVGVPSDAPPLGRHSELVQSDGKLQTPENPKKGSFCVYLSNRQNGGMLDVHNMSKLGFLPARR